MSLDGVETLSRFLEADLVELMLASSVTGIGIIRTISVHGAWEGIDQFEENVG